jgi:hypothetical protein
LILPFHGLVAVATGEKTIYKRSDCRHRQMGRSERVIDSSFPPPGGGGYGRKNDLQTI